MLEDCRTIDGVEAKLREEVNKRKVSLIVELPLTDDDVQTLNSAITRDQEGFALTPGNVEEYAPLAFACFLVWMGIEHYEEGRFWAEVEKALGRGGGPDQQHWGDVFLNTLKRHGLTVFNVRGHKYVTPILLQGGIPDYCLPDFFDNVLYPIVDGSLDADLSEIDDIVAEWRMRSSLYLTTDKPVQRFLEQGGKPAADFLSRCIEMARVAYDGETIPSAQELGLPTRVVRKFEDWWAKNRSLTRSSHRPVFRRPVILLDTYYGEVQCRLPKQTIPNDGSNEPVSFQVSAGQCEVHSSSVRCFMRTRGIVTERTECFLPPSKQYHVRLIRGQEPLREWEVEGVRDETWMAFHDNERLITSSELPRKRFWLIFPIHAVLEPEGCIQERREGAGDWTGYQYCLLDASEAESLSFVTNTGSKVLLPLAADKEPMLLGQPVPDWNVKEVPVYTQNPPSLEIPLSSPEEIDRRNLILEDLTGSVPTRTPPIPLVKVVSVTPGKSAVRFSLSDIKLFETRRFGLFRVRLRGPLGRDQQFRFAFIQDLEYEFDRHIYLANDWVYITLLTVPGLKIISEEEGTSVTGENGLFEVSVGPESRFVTLSVEDEEGRKLPLTITIPRLQWAVRSRKNRFLSGWCGDSRKIKLEDLEASDGVSLVIHAPISDGTRAVLKLEGTLQKEEAEVHNGKARFTLNRFCDSLRNLGRPLARFSLSFLNSLLVEQRIYPVQVITQWTVEDFSCVDKREGNQRILLLSWQDEGCLRDRRLRLWNLWRVWEVPPTFSIPDEASGFEFVKPVSSVHPGLYRVEFFVEDEYSDDSSPVFVPKLESNVFDIMIGDEEESVNWLVRNEEKPFQYWLTCMLAQRHSDFDIRSCEVFASDAERLFRVLLFFVMEDDSESAMKMWNKLSEPQQKQLRPLLRERIKAYYTERDEDTKRAIPAVCKVCNTVDESVILFEVGSKVKFDNKIAQFLGISKTDSGDFLCLKYADKYANAKEPSLRLTSEEKVPVSRIGEMRKADDADPLSRQ